MARTIAEQTEDWVEDYLVKRAIAEGALAPKVKGLRGWPDRNIIWFNGVIDFIETKRPKGGQFEPLQLRIHAKLRQRGHNVFVFYNRAQVDEYIRSRRGSWRSSALPLRQARSENDSGVGADAEHRAPTRRRRTA